MSLDDQDPPSGSISPSQPLPDNDCKGMAGTASLPTECCETTKDTLSQTSKGFLCFGSLG